MESQTKNKQRDYETVDDNDAGDEVIIQYSLQFFSDGFPWKRHNSPQHTKLFIFAAYVMLMQRVARVRLKQLGLGLTT